MKPEVLTTSVSEQTIQPDNACLLRSHITAGVILGPGDTIVDQTDKISVSTNIYPSGGYRRYVEPRMNKFVLTGSDECHGEKRTNRGCLFWEVEIL